MPTATSTASLTRTALTTAAGVDWRVVPLGGVPDAYAAVRDGLAAAVPGEVHTDLLAAELIPDPFDGANESALQWIGAVDWRWRGHFGWDADARTEDRHELVITGLDTVAVITLNGVELGRAANQHRSHRFDVADALRDGPNTLEITITGPYPAAAAAEARLGARPKAYDRPFNALRKMASAYGWDWGPDLAGAGVLGDVAIESWSGVRVASVAAHARWDGAAELALDVTLEWAGGDAVELTVECDGATVAATATPGTHRVRLATGVPDGRPWWPRGHGDQPLTPAVLRLDGARVWSRRLGFRTVAVSTAPDAAGSEFVITVNGRPVWVRGANWIPADALMSRLDRDRYRTAITDAVDAGMNLLRVWGGGIYEAEDFYDACDEAGILVWQDFPFACAAYSEEEPLRGEVEAEAREAIVRLSAHPSLALWNGNNENIWGYVDWGWRAQLDGASWGDGYYTGLLPQLVAELAPGTPYTPGSPYSFADYHYPNDPRHGTMHIWDVWNLRDYAVYAHYRPRFVSEFGFQGPPAWSTLTSVVHDQPLDPYGPQLLVHQKAQDGNLKLEKGLGDHLPSWPVHDGVADMDDWHWLTSLNQARAVAFGITHFRSLAPHTTGSIVWQLNDNWPVVSWAAVDAHGIRKPLWYALRRVYADRFAAVVRRPVDPPRWVDLLGSDPCASEPTLTLHNDTDQEWAAELIISRRGVGLESAELARQEAAVVVPPRTRIDVALDPAVGTPDDPASELIDVAADGGSLAQGWFTEDTALVLLPPEQAYRVQTRAVTGGAEVTVIADAVVKDLALFPDRLDPAARVDSGLITLLAGQRHTFAVRTEVELDLAALAVRPVLRSVNDVIARD